MWDIAMFENGTIGGSGYNFDISFFNESETAVVDNPCTSQYGHHLVCINDLFGPDDFGIDNGIIVTDKWILTSATACLNIYENPWNDYFIQAGNHNLTNIKNGSMIKDYHMYGQENSTQQCNQHDDYCLIELETPLVISESIQAIGFQHFATTTNATTTGKTALDDSLDRCWIAAWSDENLRTFKADVSSGCQPYYPDENIPFFKNKLTTEQKSTIKKKIEAYRKTFENFTSKNPDVRTEDEYGRRSHLCLDNLENFYQPTIFGFGYYQPAHSFGNPGGPLVCINDNNEPILMGMIDMWENDSRVMYDRVEYALSWMDKVITGKEFRNVFHKRKA